MVLPGLDLALPEPEWQALGPHEPDETTGRRRPSLETHPQFHLKLLLDRMSVGRGEVALWRRGGGRDAPAARSRAIAHAMAPPAFTGKWQGLKPAERRLTGVRALELADPAEEAQAIALALREALEEPGRTAALVTPDREPGPPRLRAPAALGRSRPTIRRGRPLAQTLPGTLLLAVASAAAERFAPVPLLALLKHPLVRAGEGRLAWLDGVRLLDLALRGPRPQAGLDGIGAHLAERRRADARACARRPRRLVGQRPCRCSARWSAPPRPPTASPPSSPRSATRSPRWRAIRPGRGPRAGRRRSCSPTMRRRRRRARSGSRPPELPALLESLLAAEAVRPPYGQHPRLFIWGLLEARLQHADLLVLGGLNEGTWPALPAPDPWLAPRLRAELGLPSLERRIGLAAHDFASALGAPRVLVTRARRDARAPAIASRFWLRLEAMTGGLTRSPELRKWARAIDKPAGARSRRTARAVARSRRAPAPHLGHRGRPAEGRSLRLLRAQDARPDGARSGRRRSDRRLARQRRPRRARGLDEGG